MASIIENIQTTLSQNFGGSAHALAPKSDVFKLEETPDLTGKVGVITGGSSGIGYGASHTLLTHNISKLYLLSDGKELAQDAIKAIAEELGQEKADRVKYIQLDLADWPKVAEVAKEISDSTDRLDILINNAARGIMTYQLTDYGVDRHFAVNHCGHVILTSHLLPLMKKTASAGHTVRISNQASNAHQQVPNDLQFKSLEDINQDLGPMPQYGRAKLTAILYARYLARELTQSYPKILVNATHPGVVSTKMSIDDIHEPYPLLGYGMSAVLEPFKKDQFEGCVSTVYAATVIEKSGRYICPPAADEEGSPQSQDMQLADDLMELTKRIIADKTGAPQKGCPMKDF